MLSDVGTVLDYTILWIVTINGVAGVSKHCLCRAMLRNYEILGEGRTSCLYKR